MVIAVRPSKRMRAEDGKLLSRLEWPKGEGYRILERQWKLCHVHPHLAILINNQGQTLVLMWATSTRSNWFHCAM